MPCCEKCKNLNVVTTTDPEDGVEYMFCRNCGHTTNGKEPPRLVASPPVGRRKW